MGWKEALQKLKSLEGGAEAADLVEAEITRLNEANYQLIGEKRKATNKLRESEEAISTLVSELNIEGEDASQKIENLKKTVKDLKTQNASLESGKQEVETTKQQLEQQLSELRRESVLREAADKAGAAFPVLKRLATDLELDPSGDEVKVKLKDESGKETTQPLREFAEQNPDWQPFLPSLFPQQQQKPSPRLPGAPPQDSSNQPWHKSFLRQMREKQVKPYLEQKRKESQV